MVRSFERRLESLFAITDDLLRRQVKNILQSNLKDNVNSYVMQEDGTYQKKKADGEEPFNIHKEFYKVNRDTLQDLDLSLAFKDVQIPLEENGVEKKEEVSDTSSAN